MARSVSSRETLRVLERSASPVIFRKIAWGKCARAVAPAGEL